MRRTAASQAASFVRQAVTLPNMNPFGLDPRSPDYARFTV
jgi:hypothetical protein